MCAYLEPFCVRFGLRFFVRNDRFIALATLSGVIVADCCSLFVMCSFCCWSTGCYVCFSLRPSIFTSPWHVLHMFINRSFGRSVRSYFFQLIRRDSMCVRARLRLDCVSFTHHIFFPLCKQTKANRSNHFKHLELNIFSFGFFVFSRTKMFLFQKSRSKN